MPNFWLIKSEPESYSIDDLERDGKTDWTGVRNFKARNFMKDFNLEQPQAWGWAAHPLIHGEKIIALVGGTNSAVVACRV